MKRSLLLLIPLLGILILIPASTLPLNARKPVLTSFCTDLTTPNQPSQGTASNLTFTCPSNPAFNAQHTTTSTPTYTLPTGYNALYITGPSTQRLTSGAPLSLPAGNYQYLAQYDGTPTSTLPSFTITWNS